MIPFPCVREIPLTQGKFALVDNEDYQRVRQYEWKYESHGYARASINGKQIRMHQFILPSEEGIDHIDHNKLNNTKGNLRAAGKSANGLNRSNSDAGISWRNQRKRYEVKIMLHKKSYHIGTFETIEGARAARSRARKKLGIDP